MNTALTDVMNQYGADNSPVLDERGLLWEIDSHGVLRGVVPESCPVTEVLERLVNWAAVLDLALVEPDRDTRRAFTYRGVADDRPVEVRGTVQPPPVTGILRSTTGTQPQRARHRPRREPDHVRGSDLPNIG